MLKNQKIKLYSSIGTAFFVVALLAGILVTTNQQSQSIMDEVPYVRTTVVKLTEAAPSYTYSGEVRGRYESKLAFQVNGKVIKRNIELGSIVRPGDVLMQIDSKDIQQNVTSSGAQVFAAQSQAKLANNNQQRYRQLYEQQAISKAEYDRYDTAYDTANALVRQAEAQHRQTVNQLGYSNLQSDSPGIVASIEAEVGQIVSAGQNIVTVVQDGEREIEISIPENRLEELRKVQQVQVEFWALPQVKLNGKVREIAPMADAVSRTYKVRIQLANPPAEIKLGMTATARVAGTEPQKTGVDVPLSAIYQTGDTPMVWVVQDGILSLRPVQISTFGNTSVHVMEGLAADDVIVTAGVHKLREGQKVRTSGATL
ncbi:efflux RND transporter periplasmic adaptor subunit [Sporomusa malonica]|uniref:RND family efflux transporter, MFP subunit n=1 Tax=Sporomusa malonica TaxID=112901 RepID=A0A1W1ZY12_9FIRM|nr:efflux RND transporter periplasmic adaptor subunit [Sporomusa malonica]SMC53294.1 RND family efflux transporter, MFP subunit [Sporomusa malonica]